MNKNLRNLLILVIALAALFYFSDQSGVQKNAVTNENIAFSASSLSNVRTINIKGGTEEIELRLKENKWIVPSKEDFPANYSKIRSFLFALERLKLGTAVSKDSAKLAEFKLIRNDSTPVLEDKSNASTLKKDLPIEVTLLDESKISLSKLFLGKSRQMIVPPGGGFFKSGGQYFRIEGLDSINSNHVFVSPEPFSVSLDISDWLKGDIVNFLLKKIIKVDQFVIDIDSGVGSEINSEIGSENKKLENKKLFSLQRSDDQFILLADNDLRTQNSGYSINTSRAHQITSALENLKISDILSKSKFRSQYKDSLFDRKTSYSLKSGALVEVYTAVIKGENFLKLRAIEDISQKTNSTKDKIKKSVEDINNLHSNWVYKIPPYSSAKFRYELDDIYQKDTP